MTATEQTNPDEFLTRVEAANVAHISTVSLDKLLRRPDAPAWLKIGRRVLIPRAEFIVWLRSHGGQP